MTGNRPSSVFFSRIQDAVASAASHPLLVSLAVFLLYNSSLVSGMGSMGGDGLLFFYPGLRSIAEALQRGTLPFWSPLVQAGFPQLADGQPGALYLPNILAVTLTATPAAYNLLLLGHELAALLFTYLFARQVGLSRTAASGAALIFALASPVAGGNLPYMESLTWLPLLLLLAEMLAKGDSRSWPVVATAATVALQWTAGFPQGAFYSAVGASAYLMARLLMTDRSWRSTLVTGLRWTLALSAGLLLAAPQLLPTLELARFSIRSGGISGSMAGEGSLFPATAATLFLPSWDAFLSASGLGIGIYVGLLPLVLALTALLAHRRRSFIWPLALTAATALFFALGRYNPLFPLFRQLPGFSSFRIPSRFLHVALLCLALLAGIGWDHLARFSRRQTRLVQLLFILTIGGYLIMGTIALPVINNNEDLLVDLARGYTEERIAGDAYHLQPDAYYSNKIRSLLGELRSAVDSRNPAVFVPFATLLVAGLAWVRWRRERPALMRALWVLLIVIDLLHFRGWRRPVGSQELVTEPPATAEILDGAPFCRIFPVTDEDAVTFQRDNLALIPANYNTLFDLASTGLYSPLGFYNYYQLLSEVGSVNLAFGLQPVSARTLAEQKPLLDFLGVCQVISRQPLRGFSLIGQSGEVRVYENREAFPQAWLVSEVNMVDSQAAAVRWLQENAAQARHIAALETVPKPSPAGNVQEGQRDSVEMVAYRPTRVQLNVNVSAPKLLVLADTHYPGWRVLVDGEERHLLRVNGLFRAVMVSPGDAVVRFEYVPMSFRRDVILSVASALLLAVWLVVKRARRSDSS